MFGYYGSKSKIVKLYPKPQFTKIIEPFAGSAQYSLLYWDRDVTLVDKYEVIVRLWKWLQQCSKHDILSIPHIQVGQTVDDLSFDCEEQKLLLGFLITGAPATPKKTPSKWKVVDRPNTQNYKLTLIANNLYKIKHWNIQLGDYKDIPNEEATWFIDPPYQFGGEYYKCSNKDIDYTKLKDWCINRMGQIIVCENSSANWLDFTPLTTMRGNKKTTVECMWTNYNAANPIDLWGV